MLNRESNCIKYKLPTVHEHQIISLKIWIKTELWLSSFGSKINSKVTDAFYPGGQKGA